VSIRDASACALSRRTDFPSVICPDGLEIRPTAAGHPISSRHLTKTTTMPELDLTFVDQAVSRIGRGPDAVIPILQAIQGHYRYLPEER